MRLNAIVLLTMFYPILTDDDVVSSTSFDCFCLWLSLFNIANLDVVGVGFLHSSHFLKYRVGMTFGIISEDRVEDEMLFGWHWQETLPERGKRSLISEKSFYDRCCIVTKFSGWKPSISFTGPSFNAFATLHSKLRDVEI